MQISSVSPRWIDISDRRFSRSRAANATDGACVHGDEVKNGSSRTNWEITRNARLLRYDFSNFIATETWLLSVNMTEWKVCPCLSQMNSMPSIWWKYVYSMTLDFDFFFSFFIFSILLVTKVKLYQETIDRNLKWEKSFLILNLILRVDSDFMILDAWMPSLRNFRIRFH